MDKYELAGVRIFQEMTSSRVGPTLFIYTYTHLFYLLAMWFGYLNVYVIILFSTYYTQIMLARIRCQTFIGMFEKLGFC